jgi:hypothetical protein
MANEPVPFFHDIELREQMSMRTMTRSDWAWFAGITIIAVLINPALKSIGLLPADVFKSLGIFFPGLPQIVFGPLIALLTLVCFVKTGEPLVFPVIGILRALSLAYIFPKNPEHLGTCIAGILVGFMAWAMMRNAGRVRLSAWLPGMAALYAGFYAAGNYLTTLMFGPPEQTQIILGSSHVTFAIIGGSLAIGLLFGAVAYGLMKLAVKLWPTMNALRMQPRQA